MSTDTQLQTEVSRERALTGGLAGNPSKTLGLGDGDSSELVATLVSTIMKPDKEGLYPSDQQVQAFLMVATKYKLNPWVKQIYAFVDTRSGGIVPIVGVDGWAQLINDHPQYDGCDFEYTGEGDNVAITCVMFRKDRTRPIRVTEFMSECKGATDPWRKTPRRMLRHRAFMQAGRIAFGIGGIHDEEEARTFAEPLGNATAVDPITGAEQPLMPTRRAPPPSPAPAPAPKPPETVDVQATEVKTPTREPTLEELFGDPPSAGLADGPAPSHAPAAATSSTDQPATVGQKANIANKCRVKGLELAQVLGRHGFKEETLTQGQFDTVRAWLAGQ